MGVRFPHGAPGPVAQWPEQSALNRMVGGSNPPGLTAASEVAFLICLCHSLECRFNL